ncbi:uncharacterized protein LOC103714285 isoform X2 [Phoenix dactylifera]|uniref:Uncharacterized protein LOC103714285 isoform X2 n=1 Tax=Phoenix dactylifera TaxID=42345 RepID=A0A8B7CI03_PHODC|nr:uncharacterized protein LOC103714285 isoform X2 [Phoenix dactylifera]
MAEFPPNPDDGELWLPSEIFPDVGVGLRHHSQPAPPDLSYLDDLAEKLAAFGLLDRSHLLRPNHHPSDGFRFDNGSVSRFGPSAEREAGAGMVYDGFRSPAVSRRVLGAAAAAAAAASRPVFPFSAAKPSQVEAFGQGRSGVMARQQQLPIRGRRFVPVRTGGTGRECGGTGVFLPRVSRNEVVAPTKNRPSRHQKWRRATEAGHGEARNAISSGSSS